MGSVIAILGVALVTLVVLVALWAFAEAARDRFARVPAEAFFREGRALEWLGDWDEALKQYALATQRKRGRHVAATAHFRMGRIHFKRRDFQRALGCFSQASRGCRVPEIQARSLYESGRCFEQMHKAHEAKTRYQQVFEKFPGSAHAGVAKARFHHIGRGRTDGRNLRPNGIVSSSRHSRSRVSSNA